LITDIDGGAFFGPNPITSFVDAVREIGTEVNLNVDNAGDE
jgi:hypothetical protein